MSDWETIVTREIIHADVCSFVPPLNDHGDGGEDCDCYVGRLYAAIHDAHAIHCERVENLEAAIREYIAMEPPATASPYWHKPDGDLRAALAAAHADAPQEHGEEGR